MSGLHHAAHATHTGGGSCRSFFFLLSDNALGGEEHACDRGCILEGYAGNLGRVDDTCGEEVLVYIGAGVVAVVTFAAFSWLFKSSAGEHGIKNFAKFIVHYEYFSIFVFGEHSDKSIGLF